MTHTPWRNDDGLVSRLAKDGTCDFDIFDADDWNGGREEGLEIAAFITTAVNSHDGLLEALEKISKGEGPFSMDPLKHAENCIEDMKLIASLAIAKAKEK